MARAYGHRVACEDLVIVAPSARAMRRQATRDGVDGGRCRTIRRVHADGAADSDCGTESNANAVDWARGAERTGTLVRFGVSPDVGLDFADVDARRRELGFNKIAEGRCCRGRSSATPWQERVSRPCRGSGAESGAVWPVTVLAVNCAAGCSLVVNDWLNALMFRRAAGA